MGVCTREEPIYIITELMSNGSLLEYLREDSGRSIKLPIIIDMAAQVDYICDLFAHFCPDGEFANGLEALPLNESQLASLDFVVNRFFMKLFKTTDMQVVEVYTPCLKKTVPVLFCE